MAKHINWSTLLLGVVLGAAGLYVFERRSSLGIFVDKFNPNEALLLNGGGHSIGG